MNFAQLTKLNETEAREYLEATRWPNGAVCPRCDGENVIKLSGKATRPGLYNCRSCRKQFSVTVGTIMERSHVAIREWIMAFHLVACSKKGISAHQLHRMIGVTYKTAWFIYHRIRHAMELEPLKTVLGGRNEDDEITRPSERIVEADETYVGGKPRKGGPKGFGPTYRADGKMKTGRGTDKTPVLVLVERGGSARSRVLDRVNVNELRQGIIESTKPGTHLMTDELAHYRKAGLGHTRGHSLVKHSENEYARGNVHINTAESFFAILKRGHYGVFHQMGKRHLHRYLGEFTFRWNYRNVKDGARREAIIKAISGKRLTYRTPKLP